MRQVAVAAACAAGLFVGSATGQFGSLGPPGSKNNLPAPMPGQVVGTGIKLNPVGTQVKQAVPSREELRKLESPMMRVYDPSKPYDVFKGTKIDPKSVAAPIAGFPMAGNDPNLLERIYQKVGTVTGFLTPSDPPRPTYTPGISRRNRERAMQRMWRRD